MKPTRLPAGELVDFELFDEFGQLSTEQKHFILKYMEMFPRKLAAAQSSGITKGVMDRWFLDEDFKRVVNSIREYYAESLAAIDMEEAITDSKIRGRVLKALKAEGYEPASSSRIGTQQNLVVTDGGGLAGVLQQINKS